MVSRKGINISVHYVVSINAMPFHICTLISQKLKRRTELYFILFLKLTTIRHGVFISGYVEFIPRNSRSCQLRIDSFIEDE